MKRGRYDFPIVSYRNVLQEAYEFYEREALGKLNALKMRTHMDVIENTVSQKREFKGDKRLADIRKYLDMYTGYERSDMQREFHEAFLQAVALHLYKEDADVDFDALMKLNDWPNLKQQVLCMTPRRFGKTTAVSMFVGAYALAVSNSNQCIFSTGKRASDKLLEQVQNLLKLIPGVGDRMKRRGEVLTLYGDDPNDIRVVSSYPAASKTLRGVGGDVIYMEEAAFMDIAIFHEVIVPLLEMDSTALICISTPQDRQNYYSVMFDMTDPKSGEKLFNSIELSLVCEQCKLGPHPEKCTHMQHLLPKWKSSAKQSMVRQIYAENSADMLRESMGVITEESVSVFESTWIQNLKSRPRYSERQAFPYLFVGCDPNGGGSSHMSIVTVGMEANTYIFLGMESHAVRGHGEIKQLLIEHVRGLRRVFPVSTIVFIPESNLGHEASHMTHMLRSETRICVLMERGEPGVNTSHKRKDLYASHSIEQFATGAVAIHEKFICCNPHQDANTRTATVIRNFFEQLGGFCKLMVQREGNYSLPKIIYTGKRTGNDDLMMTMLIALFWATQFMTGKSTPNYRDAKDHIL